jgi:type I restriction enzyme, S subunit
LSAARLKDVEFPIPPIEEQRRIIDVASQRLDAVKALSGHVGIVERRSGVMRRAVLAAAFEGKLTGRQTDTEVIEELADVQR